MFDMNGSGRSGMSEGVHGLEDRAVFALTQLMALYLDKNSFEKQDRKDERPSDAFGGAQENVTSVKNIQMNALRVLENPVPAALKSGMRAVGTALYQETKSTEAMNDVLYRVLEKFPNRDQEIIRVLDHAFDGIGGWWA